LGARPAIQLLDRCPLVDEVISTQSLGVEHWGSEGNDTIDARIARMLHEHGPFDLVFDALQAPRAVRDLLWGAKVGTVEIDQDVQRATLREGLGVRKAGLAGAEAGWNLPVTGPQTASLELPHQHQVAAQGWLLRHRLASSRIAAVSPVASLNLKRWPLERLAQVADELAQQMDEVLVVAGPEQALGAELIECMAAREQAVPVEPMHLLDTAALLQRCEVLLCNDTGLMHLAAAVGTAVVGVFGPTSPRLYQPREPHAQSVCEEPIDCPHRRVEEASPPDCWYHDTCLLGERSCIDRVQVDSVRNATRQLIDLTSNGKPVPAIAS
jgi:hypothetical protein